MQGEDVRTSGRPSGCPAKGRRFGVSALLAGACLSSLAASESRAQVPVGQAITRQAAPEKKDEGQPSAAVQQAAQPAATPQPEPEQSPATFYVAAYDISGARTLDQATVEEAVYPFAGPDKTPADVAAAAKALQDAYKARGYEAVQVDVPPQPEGLFAQGIVQLVVTEAPIGQVRVTGSKYHALSIVRNQVPSLTEGKVLNSKDLERDLGNANRFPDRTVSPSFKAGVVPGTIDVDLAVEDSLPVHGSLELNNDSSPNTEPLRANASLSYSNLWQKGHTLSLSYGVAPQAKSQSEVISGSYTAPILGTDWTAVLYGYKSNSNVASVGGVSVLGNGYQIGVRAVLRLPSRTTAQSLTFGVDYKNFKQDVQLDGTATAKAPIEYMPLFAGYGFSAGGDKSNLDINVSVTAGLRVFKRIRCFEIDQSLCNDTNTFNQFVNRNGLRAYENFVHGNLDLTYRRALPRDFVGTFKLFGQLADSRQITNEQFSIGGLSTVRGYYLSEAVSDEGYSASLELATPSIAKLFPGFVDELRFYGFVDHGFVRGVDPGEDEIYGYSLTSVGGGARIKLFKHISGEIAVGFPLQNGPTTQSRDPRATFTAKGEF